MLTAAYQDRSAASGHLYLKLALSSDITTGNEEAQFSRIDHVRDLPSNKEIKFFGVEGRGGGE